MTILSRRSLPLLLLPLALAAALVAVPAVAFADSLSWSRTYAGPPNLPNGDSDPIPVAGAFNAVSFSDASHGWAVGVRVNGVGGTPTTLPFVAFSSDGGQSWTPNAIDPVTVELNGVLARSATDVWVVGKNATIARWNGVSWTKKTIPSWPATRAIQAIAFVDDVHGWAVGDGQGIAQTSDGGNTWSLLVTPTPSANAYRAIGVVDSTTAIAVGDGGYARRITTTSLANRTQPSSNALWGIAFSDSLHGWAVGDNATTLRTQDGGLNWTPTPVPPAAQGALVGLRGVAFSDAANGVMVGQYQAVWRTMDGGSSWTYEALYDSGTLDDLELRSAAFVAGSADSPVTVGRRKTSLGLTSSDDKARAYLGAWTDRTLPPPAAPTGVIAASGGDPLPSILVSWNDVSSDEDGFVVERTSGSAAGPYSAVQTLTAGATSWTDTGVDWGSTWYYRVKSFRGDLYSSPATSNGFKVDTVAPVTQTNATSAYLGSATISLSASDPGGSGVARTVYTIDGGIEREGMQVTVSGAGPHSVTFWSEDLAGNAEAPQTVEFTITLPDTTKPNTTSNATSSYVGGANITLFPTDNVAVAHTYYRIGSGTVREGTTVIVSSTGSYTLEFWSVDTSNNEESPHKFASFEVTPLVVDTQDPVTTSDAKATYVGSAHIALSPSDNVGVADTRYSIDGAPDVSGTSINVSGVGEHSVEFWSFDWAGNVEDHHTVTFTITAPPVVDTQAPVTTSTAKASYVGIAVIVFSATDNVGVAHTYHMLDGAAQAEGATLTVTAVGTHTLEYWSVDAAGNQEVHRYWNFEVTAPVVAPVTTTITLKSSATSTRLNRYITLSSVLSGGLPLGTHVRFSVRLPGKSSYTTISSKIDVLAAGKSSYRYKVTKRGTYYFQARFLGITGFKSSISKTVKVVVK